MKIRDYGPLLAAMEEIYSHRSPRSAALQQRAEAVLIDGGSHSLRLVRPFPPRIVTAQGAWLEDEDGHSILDFWQGHLGNILGHNPPLVTSALASALTAGRGLQTGFTDRLQVEVAEILCRQTNSEAVRFTTSGTLATMYAILLARAYTGRTLVMKVGGGWHGAQPWALKGIGYRGSDGGFQGVESAGVPTAVTDKVVVSGFNDPDALRAHFRQLGDRLSCFIVEPFLGAGGFAPASREYLQLARELTERHGALLVFDEVIAGFRFRAGSLGALYGLQPDLATFGKIIGGGMPVSAVAGRRDILRLASRAASQRVSFSGGTFSAHPAALLAAKTILTYLAEHEAEVYPRLAQRGEQARQALTSAFQEAGIPVTCTGHGPGLLPGSSMFMLHFPYDQSIPLDRPQDWLNPALCDIEMSQRVLPLALLLEGVFLLHSHGAVSAAHTDSDIEYLSAACRRAVRRIKPFL